MIMKHLRIFAVHLKEGFKGLYRNFGLAFTSIITTSITLIVVSLSILISMNVYNFSKLIEEDVTIYASINVETEAERIEVIQKQVESIENVASVRYSTKEQERDFLMTAWPDMKEILEHYEGENNPLKDIFYVKVKDVNEIKKVAEELRKIEEIDEIEYGEKIVESLISTFEIVRYVGIAVIIALLLVTVFVISNTIKITIFSRKQSIEIIRLIGAKKSYIVAPHLVEGFLIGLLGSIPPILVTIFGYKKFFEATNGKLSFSPFITFVEPYPFVFQLSLGILAVGVFVGVLGSRRSVRKFLRKH